jgi:Secretory lipase
MRVESTLHWRTGWSRASAVLGTAIAATVAVVAGVVAPAGASPAGTDGSVVSAQPLDPALWVPGTGHGYRLSYVSRDGFGHTAVTTGEVLIPTGPAPRGGWPVISWAHGTSGLADACAPSRVGPAERARDFSYLAAWMRQGYAIVGTDYAGLGAAGLPAYLNGASEAHNIVDMVTASRAFAASRLPSSQHLASRYVIVGQSQGGGAAIYTARYATSLGGPGLSYRGAVGTGTPANIEKVLLPLGPKSPPVALTPGITSYIAYIFASLRHFHPELGIDGILTGEGRKYLAMAEQQCVDAFDAKLTGVNVGDWFARPVATLPNFAQTLSDYMAMPTSGFDTPFFMANGLEDTDVPFAVVAPYVAELKANGEPVEFHTYPTDHNGTMAASLPDSIPFVRRQMG